MEEFLLFRQKISFFSRQMQYSDRCIYLNDGKYYKKYQPGRRKEIYFVAKILGTLDKHKSCTEKQRNDPKSTETEKMLQRSTVSRIGLCKTTDGGKYRSNSEYIRNPRRMQYPQSCCDDYKCLAKHFQISKYLIVHRQKYRYPRLPSS